MGTTLENAGLRTRGRRTSICLCMIVKDEADTVGAALRSCRDLIDYWVICDTGSTDATQEAVRHALEGIPGELHQDEWIDFGHNRNRLMDRARGRSEYLLLLDADETVEVAPGGLDGLALDAYTVAVVGDTLERVKRVVRGWLPWRFVGAVCEYIESPLEQTNGRLDGLVIRSQPPRARQQERWLSDRGLLEAAVGADPDDARSAFYLACNLHAIAVHSGDHELMRTALRTYEHRVTMYGADEEAYCSLLQAGALCEELNDWPSACEYYLRAWQVRPTRLESVYATASGLLTRRLPRVAARFTSLAETRLAVPDDATLHIIPWIYDWGLLMLHSVATLDSGEPDASLAASKRLLSLPGLPDERREAATHNLALAVRDKVTLTADAATSQQSKPDGGRF